jgi:N-acetyl-beta-hexosaminidase
VAAGEAGHEHNQVIRLQMNTQLNVAEEYLLEVSAKGVTLQCGDSAGCFWATQTFLQLLPPAVFNNQRAPVGVEWHLPFVRITDHPAFKWRGVHCDVARHFMNADWIVKLIDSMALHKLNVLHLHLTDDQGFRSVQCASRYSFSKGGALKSKRIRILRSSVRVERKRKRVDQAHASSTVSAYAS